MLSYPHTRPNNATKPHNFISNSILASDWLILNTLTLTARISNNSKNQLLMELLLYSVGWGVIWCLFLYLCPRGQSGRHHLYLLNALHGSISTILAAYVLFFDLETTVVCAATISYFLIDVVYMAHSDGVSTIPRQPLSRKLDYAHHVFGFIWGVALFATQNWICVSSNGSPVHAYVWIQTNEVSTPFYNWYRISRKPLAGVLFVTSFFLSRILFNTIVLVPKFYRACNFLAFAGCFPYFILQYAWFYMIVRKINKK